MSLSKSEITQLIRKWLLAWDEHNLDEVMELLHEEVIFENWTGACISGKDTLRKSWRPWFGNHGNFKFTEEDLFVDEQEQKAVFAWSLVWPSVEMNLKGKQEIRRGVDVLHFKDGLIHRKYTYTKTTLQIDGKPVILAAQNSTFI
jgi:hypothetical protein